jgi:hypothetical protein
MVHSDSALGPAGGAAGALSWRRLCRLAVASLALVFVCSLPHSAALALRLATLPFN